MTEVDNSSFVDYEITLLFAEEDSSSIKKVFAKNGIVVTDEKPLQKIQLTYPIKKYSQGFLGLFKFQALPAVLPVLFDNLKLEKNILRYLVHSAIIKGEEKKFDIRAGLDKKRTRRPVKEAQKSYDSVLTNEALQEKIEEILK